MSTNDDQPDETLRDGNESRTAAQQVSRLDGAVGQATVPGLAPTVAPQPADSVPAIVEGDGTARSLASAKAAGLKTSHAGVAPVKRKKAFVL